MDSSKLLGITTFIYLFSTVIYMLIFIFRFKKVGLLATVVTIIGLLVNTAGIGMRWLESYQMGIGHAPLSNMYESLVFFAWSIVVLYLIVEFVLLGHLRFLLLSAVWLMLHCPRNSVTVLLRWSLLCRVTG